MKSALSAVYCNEAAKVGARKKYTVFVILGALLSIGGILPVIFLNRVAGVMIINFDAYYMWVLPMFAEVVLPLLIFMAATDLFAAEAHDGVIRASLTRPVDRIALFTGKLAAVMTYAAVYLGCIFLTGLIVSFIMTGPDALWPILAGLGSYLLTLVPLAVLACFAALVAQTSKSGTLVMLLCLLIYLAAKVVTIFIPVTTELLFTSFLGWHKLWIGAAPSAGKLLNVTLTVLGYGALFFTAGSMIFTRKDY